MLRAFNLSRRWRYTSPGGVVRAPQKVLSRGAREDQGTAGQAAEPEAGSPLVSCERSSGTRALWARQVVTCPALGPLLLA
jgi:hypothetical protein